nr:ORF7 [Alphacoronavirus sp.]
MLYLKMFTEEQLDSLVIFLWLGGTMGYITMYQWWYKWFTTGVLPDDTWFIVLLLFLFCCPAYIDFFSPGFLESWCSFAQSIHDNILRWLFSDMRPLGFLKWILVCLGLVLYTTVVQW